MIFLNSPQLGYVWSSFPGGYLLFPEKLRWVIHKNSHLSSPEVLCFWRARCGTIQKQLRGGFIYTPRFDSHRIEPEVMMIWLRWFSFCSGLFSGSGSVHLPGFFKAIFLLFAQEGLLWRTLHVCEDQLQAADVGPYFWNPYLGREKLRKSKTPGFLAAFFWLSGGITWNKKRQFQSKRQEKEQKNGRHEERTVDLVRKRLFEGW